MSDEARWYVVHTYSGYENKVAQNIEKVVDNRGIRDLICEVKVPMERYEEVDKSGEVKQSERKLFPSYVMVKMVMTDDSWYIVRNTRGVTGFVGPGSKPIPLTEAEVAALGVEMDTIKPVAISFTEGDEVTVVSGSFEGFVGKVLKIDSEAHTADVIVSMFGRETPVTLPLEQIKKAD